MVSDVVLFGDPLEPVSLSERLGEQDVVCTRCICSMIPCLLEYFILDYILPYFYPMHPRGFL